MLDVSACLCPFVFFFRQGFGSVCLSLSLCLCVCMLMLSVEARHTENQEVLEAAVFRGNSRSHQVGTWVKDDLVQYFPLFYMNEDSDGPTFLASGLGLRDSRLARLTASELRDYQSSHWPRVETMMLPGHSSLLWPSEICIMYCSSHPSSQRVEPIVVML